MLSLSTGPLHLATTYDRPVVGIFHHELLERWHPLNPRGTVVTPPPGSRTLDEVTTGQVLEAARRVLALPGAP
jgi:ADP-heptose:LPS heptosyltransferase